ncbi:MAG: pyrimidine-nucleoside phosphorylase, partial [Megasphaera micronuciformis]
MWPVDFIEEKRDGKEQSASRIKKFIEDYTQGRVADYQAAAWLMAVYLKGMNEGETAALTEAMRDSGEIVDLSAIEGVTVDKHSTGGIADTTTLIVAPLVAAAGVKVAKMSGRGLGFTGGTLDKLESVPGFRITLSKEEFFNQVNRIGLAVIGQSGELAPADKLLYALRDATGTVESIPLIA